MKITGKAKEDFETWLLTKGNDIIKNGSIEYDLYYMCKYMIPENMVCAKIIEWLDSVGIYISINSHPLSKGFSFYLDYDKRIYSTGVTTRHEATKQAINKAIEIYNNR